MMPTRAQKRVNLVFLFRLVGKLMRRLSTQDQNFKQVFAELLALKPLMILI